MKKIILEDINRIKLLMNYNNKTTLTENLEKVNLVEIKEIISEQGVKTFLKSLFGTADEAAINALKTTQNAKYLASKSLLNDVKVYGSAGFNNVDDLITAMAKGSLSKSQLSGVAKGLLKSGKATGNLRTQLVDKAAEKSLKLSEYANLTQKQIKSKLIKKGYDPAIADEIAGKVINKRTALPKPNSTKTGNKPTNTKTGNKKPKQQPGKPTNWQQFKDKIRGLSRSKVAKYLVAAGGLYLLYKWYTSEGTTPFPSCLTTNMSDVDLQKMHDEGVEYVVISETGDEVLDNNGGGQFYDDKTFKTGNGKYSGTWSESGDGMLIEIGSNTYKISCGVADDEGEEDEDEVITSTWTDCSTFPLTRGCKSELVRKVQQCIGTNPDGKFGPNTESKLKEKGYNTTIDEPLYNQIIKNCGGQSDTNVSTTTTTTIRPIHSSQSET